MLGCAGVALFVAALHETSASDARSPVPTERRSNSGFALSAPSVHIDASIGDSGAVAALCSDFRTIDLGGEPIANARVIATTPGTPARLVEERTDEAGMATVCVPGVRFFWVEARAEDGRWSRTLAHRSAEPVKELVLFEPFDLRGQVIDERGEPIAGARLWVAEYRSRNDARWYYGAPPSTSDAAGRFALAVGELGLYELYAEHPSYLRASQGPVGVRPGEAMEVSLVLRDAAMVRGRVSHRGQPVADAAVRTGHNRVVTGEDGMFALGPLDVDRAHVLRVVADGYAPRDTDPLATGPHEHHIELERGSTLRIQPYVAGLLRNCLPEPIPPVDGMGPLEVASTDVTVLHGAEVLEEAWSSDVRHSLVFHDLPAGRVEVRLKVFGFDTEVSATLSEGATTELDVEVTVPPDRGIVLVRADLPETPRGRDTGHVSVQSADLRTDAPYRDPGVCVLLPEGDRRITVTRGDYEGEAEVEVVAGRRVGVRVLLARIPAVVRLPEIAVNVCSPRVTWLQTARGWIVETIPPGTPTLLPGDRLLEIDGAPPRSALYVDLAGRPGTTVELLVERPDGTNARAVLTRDCAP